MCIDGIIDNEAGFHSDLPDVFQSEVIVKADFVCCTWKGAALADNKWHVTYIYLIVMF